MGVYALSNPEHYNQYNHFVWQADAFLHGRAWIPFPEAATATTPGNELLPGRLSRCSRTGRTPGAALLPFPPLPAVLLLPFVRALGPRGRPGVAGDRARGVGVFTGLVDARRAADHARGPGRSRRSCSPPGPSGGGPRPSAAPGTSPTSSRPSRRCSRSASRSGPTRPRPTRTVGRGRPRPGGGEAGRPPTARAGPACWRASPGRPGRCRRAGARRADPRRSARPRACRSCSPRRSSCSSAAAARRSAATISAAVGGVAARRGAARLHVAHDGLRAPPGLRLPVPARGQRLPDPRLPPRLGGRGHPLRAPEPRDHARRAARGPARRSSPTRWACTRRPCCAPRPARPAACSTPTARSRMPIDIGTSVLLSSPGLLLALFAIRRRPIARLTLGAGLTVLVVGAVQPRPLQPGLGPVGLPVLARLHPVPAAPRRARRRARRRRAAAGDRDRAPGRRARLINLWGVVWGQLLGW